MPDPGTSTFAIIPEWLLYSALSNRAVRLYGVLNLHISDGRHLPNGPRLHPSRKRLASLMGCSIASVDRALEELKLLGVVKVTPHFSDSGQTSNLYVLHPYG